MKRLCGLPALLLVACAEAFGQTDGFPEQLKAGCNTEDQCKQLVAQARARQARCRDNTIGYVRCSDAQADHEIATALLQRKVDAREKVEADQLAHQRELQNEEEKARRDERYNEQKAAEEAELKRRDDAVAEVKAEHDAKVAKAAKVVADQQERLRLLGPDGRAVELKQCLHDSTEGCDAVLMALMAVADSDAEKAGLVKLDQKLRGELQRKQDQFAATAPHGSGSSSGGGGDLYCGDGSVSGCACSGSHRGCCSHHGGVAGCR
jgi:hypothetical protein